MRKASAHEYKESSVVEMERKRGADVFFLRQFQDNVLRISVLFG